MEVRDKMYFGLKVKNTLAAEVVLNLAFDIAADHITVDVIGKDGGLCMGL
jgi:hypothetical protein